MELLIILFTSYTVSAQQLNEIKGIVTSGTDNLPLAGVNVALKGAKGVTSSGFDGEFTINASSNDVLVFSFIGFKNQEVQVG
ncbi:carboxypeptidase-like regulatory domain-containing protein, partial [Flavobacterium polysaccharolyticum]